MVVVIDIVGGVGAGAAHHDEAVSYGLGLHHKAAAGGASGLIVHRAAAVHHCLLVGQAQGHI